MNSETKICQNCKASFEIDTSDFEFYDKIQVPPPTFCPECRFQRRLMFRNERILYKNKCDFCNKNIITVFSPNKSYKIYCGQCWWGDGWDGLDYGQDYDQSRSFFEQFKEIQQKVPYQHLIVSYTTLVNSEYINHAGYAKDCYLIFNSDQCENVLYSTTVNYVKDSMDLNIVGAGSELCYWDINCGKCYKVFFSEDCLNCYDIYFSKNLSGCSNCVGCVNLKNKNYHIFNIPYSKEEYEKKLKGFKFNSFSFISEFKDRVYRFWDSAPHKFMRGVHNVNVSGDYIYGSKNLFYGYQCEAVENGKFCQFITLGPAKDLFDYTEWGNNAQRIYDCITVGEGASDVKFCSACWSSVSKIEYSMFCINSSDLFGCVGLKKKQYCILNKQYSKEEYEKLRKQIVHDMNERPYIDGKGRIWGYGEFFPYDLSLFDYNETTATQFYPLLKEEILKRGWRWREPTIPENLITLSSDKIPDDISYVSEEILKEVLSCTDCGKPFRLVKAEFDLLKRFNFPIPHKCSNCRHMERQTRINPPRLWDKKCSKCGKDIKTSYAPDGLEIVYCEKCYQQEVI